MRRKRIELEQAVIAAAREWSNVVMTWNDAFDAANRLREAVSALDNYEPPTITGRDVRWSDNDTSLDAALSAGPLQNSTRHAIVALLVNPGRMAAPGLTDAQIETRLGKSHQTVSSARNWLVEHGWVIYSGVKRRTPSGRLAKVWMLSPAAQRRLRRDG